MDSRLGLGGEYLMTSLSLDGTDDLYASPSARDAFLRAIDSENRDELNRLAQNLIRCSNPLPGTTRDELGLATGATYGMAARHILNCDSQVIGPMHPNVSNDADRS